MQRGCVVDALKTNNVLGARWAAGRCMVVRFGFLLTHVAVQRHQLQLQHRRVIKQRTSIHTGAARRRHSVSDAAARFSSIHTPLRRLDLNDNRMDTFPEELCVMFPNAEWIAIRNNQLRTLPDSVCLMSKLQRYAGFGRGC